MDVIVRGEGDVRFDSRPDTYLHISVVRGYLLEVVKELVDRAHEHDASKLEAPELETFDRFTQRLRSSTFGSDEYKENLRGMGEALDHHYANNRHHPQHYPNGIDDMTLMDLIEMICDWMAAVQRHDDGDIDRSIEINQPRFEYGDQLKRIFQNTVKALSTT